MKREIGTDLFGTDRFADRFETTDQQATGIIADVEVGIVVGQGWQIAFDAVDRVGQQVKMFAGPQRYFHTGERGIFTAPETGANGDRVAIDFTLFRDQADHAVIACLDSGDAAVFEDFSPPRPSTLDQCRAKIGGADTPVFG